MISSISTPITISSSSAPTLNQSDQDLVNRIKKFKPGWCCCNDKSLVTKLRKIEPDNLAQILNKIASEIAEGRIKDDPLKLIEKLIKLIPLNKLEEALNDDDQLEDVKNLYNEAECYLNATHPHSHHSLKAYLHLLLEGLTTLIETLIATFGISDFFKGAESEQQAENKARKILMMLTLLGALTTLLIPLLGAAQAGLIIGSTMLGFMVLSLIWPLIKPMPAYLPANAENWTKEIQQGCKVPEGRKDSLDKIAAIIKMNRHVLLLGPSRTGKSLTAKAFAQAIHRGDYPELKGSHVFRINTSELVEQRPSFNGSGGDVLKKITDAIGRHKEKVILVLDELHQALIKNGVLANKLKTLLDEGGGFAHVIGISTQKEFDEHISKDVAFALRFDQVKIKNTAKEETIKILSDMIIQDSSHPLVAPDALEYIYETTLKLNNEAPQPFDSTIILKRSINAIKMDQLTPIGIKITEISNTIRSLRSQLAANRADNANAETRTKLLELKKQRKKLKEQSAKDTEELHSLFKTKNLFDRVTEQLYRKVVNIHRSSKNETDKKMFLMLREVLSPVLRNYIFEKSQKLGVNLIIDKALVDKMASPI